MSKRTTLMILRGIAKERGESAVIAMAEKHGAKIHCNDAEDLIVPKCPWVVLDQQACLHLYYGWFPSKYDAAVAYCVYHTVLQ